MSFKEILEELPKLTQEEKWQLWTVLDQELAQGTEEESPDLLAAIDEGIRSLESGERTYTIEEARQLVAETVAKARNYTGDVFGHPFSPSEQRCHEHR
jgi:hypothetical protein